MADMSSLNSTEYVYEQKNEGRVKVKRSLMVLLYLVFGIGLFVLCLSINPYLFAIGPLCVYILFLCTWRLVKYDCYWEFAQGNLAVGRIKANKHGRHKIERFTVHIKEAEEIGCFSSLEPLGELKKVYDYSESPNSDKRVYIIFRKDGERCVLIVEATARLGNLLASFCPNAKDVKGKPFHG